VEIRIAEPVWHTDESGAEASLVERLEAQVESLTRKVGRLERRQQRFADMIRLLLQLHDQTTTRLSALDGRSSSEDDEELSAAVGEITRVTMPAGSPASPRPRRAVSRRKDA
jgi:predicted nuclease with TOPRIM domain